MIAPGEVAYAADVATIRIYQASANGNLLLTEAPADVPGVSIVCDTTRPAATVWIIATVDMQSVGSGSTNGVATINVDGVDVGPQAVYNQANMTAGGRSTVATAYTATLPPGPHTIKLRGFRSGGADNVIRINSLHTQISALVVE